MEWYFGKYFFCDNTFFFQLLQTKREGFGANPFQVSLQLSKSLRSTKKNMNDIHCPFASDNFESFRNSTCFVITIFHTHALLFVTTLQNEVYLILSVYA